MKILHTSDWHLGRSFGTYGLLPDQELFLDWFVSTAVASEVELVVVAGDIYDRTTPPAEAMRAFDRTVAALNDAGIEVAAISGNHDSPDRVAMYHSFTENSGLILRGGYPDGADVVVRTYSDGPLAIAAIPFLDPRMIPADFGLLDPADGPFTHNTVVQVCAKAAAAAVPPSMRSLAIAHGFIAGGKGSDSERTPVISVGASDHIGAEVFEAFSYTALGHLHRPQIVRKNPNIRYSGTPLPYSFSETGQKSVALVDMDSTGSCTIELIDVPVGKRVRVITGSFDELMTSEPDSDSLIRVELTDATAVRDAKRRLETRFPYIVELKLVNIGIGARLPGVAGPADRSLANDVRRFLEAVGDGSSQLDHFDMILEALDAAGADTAGAAEIRSEIAAHNDAATDTATEAA